MFLSLLILLSYALGFVFCVVCLACGLYYFSELVEEHATVAKRWIKYTMWLVMGIIVLLGIFEDLDFTSLLLSFIGHCCYYTLLTEFPFVTLTGFKFILSVLSFIISHISWFMYFRNTDNWYPFGEIIAIFTFCVWLIPLIFFISLAANDNSLPMANSYSSHSNSNIIGVDSEFTKKKSRISVLKSMFAWVKEKTSDITGQKSMKHYY
ncbi:hypothetical protein RB653_005041 [Dictyostelium firmibasis]|uniref:Protein TEX261 n=1 Tax=Dictyostelium firmibasis TaxID=79012 RepID=A0AAN7YYW6_9MYCE